MKYITTDKHPELKEGLIINIIFFPTSGVHYYDENKALHCILSGPELVEKGYIKEVEEKEYTKSDMINYGDYRMNTLGGGIEKSEGDIFDNWLKYIHNSLVSSGCLVV